MKKLCLEGPKNNKVDHRTNFKLQNIIETIKKLKGYLTDHVACLKDNFWTIRLDKQNELQVERI